MDVFGNLYPKMENYKTELRWGGCDLEEDNKKLDP